MLVEPSVARSLMIVGFVSLVTVFSGSPVQAADTCVGATLGGGATMPVSDSGTLDSLTDAFTPTGSGCSNQGGDDIVLCLTPQNSCTVTFGCSVDGTGGISNNIYQSTSCGSIGTGSACAASNNGSGLAFISDYALSAGVDYCFVCDNVSTSGTNLLSISLVETMGSDCGALPVALTDFSIE
jgi:hypothetical protein